MIQIEDVGFHKETELFCLWHKVLSVSFQTGGESSSVPLPTSSLLVPVQVLSQVQITSLKQKLPCFSFSKHDSKLKGVRRLHLHRKVKKFSKGWTLLESPPLEQDDFIYVRPVTPSETQNDKDRKITPTAVHGWLMVEESTKFTLWYNLICKLWWRWMRGISLKNLIFPVITELDNSIWACETHWTGNNWCQQEGGVQQNVHDQTPRWTGTDLNLTWYMSKWKIIPFLFIWLFVFSAVCCAQGSCVLYSFSVDERRLQFSLWPSDALFESMLRFSLAWFSYEFFFKLKGTKSQVYSRSTKPPLPAHTPQCFIAGTRPL